MFYQDNERNRKARYLYASFICGLLHDAEKIFYFDVVSVNNEMNDSPTLTWLPLEESLISWANKNKISTYEIIWRKIVVNVHNVHNVRTSILFEGCMNRTSRKYLSGIATNRIYDSMISATDLPLGLNTTLG